MKGILNKVANIAPDGEIPDVEQFIEYISNYVKKKIS